MPGWIIAAAVGSIVITALLTFALWRMNKPMLERHRNGDGGGYAPSHDRHDTSDSFDGGSDGGGGDGGGD